MDANLLLWLRLLASFTGLSVALLAFVAYELRQLRKGRASMSFWEAVESVHRKTTPDPPTSRRKTPFGTL